MLRMLQAVLCAGAFFLLSGCNQEVTEKPPADEKTTPRMSEEERQKLLDAENKRNLEALKKRKETDEKAGRRKGGKEK